jgi:malate permease and related proteins
LSELLVLFMNNLLPIFLAAGAGFLLSRALKANPRSLSQVIFYILSPCLIFNLLTHNRLSGADVLRMVAFTLLTMAAVGGLAWLAGHLLHLERPTLAAVLITCMFNNAGNFGLPVVLFAFKEEALAYATIFFVTNAILTYSLGVVIASMGSTSFLKAAGNLLRIPTLYALIAALLFVWSGIRLPLPVERTTQLLGDASIPTMLVLLGMQFESIQWAGQARPLALISAMRLLVAPAIAIVWSGILGLRGVVHQAGVLEAAMPAAVLNTVLATEYNLQPSLVTAAVFLTTLLSPLTLTPLLALLGG